MSEQAQLSLTPSVLAIFENAKKNRDNSRERFRSIAKDLKDREDSRERRSLIDQIKKTKLLNARKCFDQAREQVA